MKNEYTAVVKQEDDWWIGWIEEVPGVNCQERTYEELKETLEVTLREALESHPAGRLITAAGLQGRKNCHMKRNELLQYLRSQGCDLLREGGKHSWWHNPSLKKPFCGSKAFRDQRYSGQEDMQRPWCATNKIATNTQAECWASQEVAWVERSETRVSLSLNPGYILT